MDNNQLALLHKLANTLEEMSAECVNDDDYNELLASLGIFSRSLDDAVSIIDGALDIIHGE